MKKFTIFTILLTIVVVVVFIQIAARDYLPEFMGGSAEISASDEGDMKLTLPKNLDIKKSIATNVLGSVDFGDESEENEEGAEESDEPVDNKLGSTAKVLPTNEDFLESPVSIPDDTQFLDPEAFNTDFKDAVDVTNLGNNAAVSTSQPTVQDGPKDFEDENVFVPSGNVYLRDEQIKSAGFVGGYLESEPLDGRLFKTIDISDLQDVEVTKNIIRTQDEFLAKVYIFKVGLNTNVSEVYEVLKMRASQGLNIRINETNEFGLASFYMNDPVRNDTAFLTVRISGLIYAFSYPKTYHSQVKNLIQLIQWELG